MGGVNGHDRTTGNVCWHDVIGDALSVQARGGWRCRGDTGYAKRGGRSAIGLSCTKNTGRCSEILLGSLRTLKTALIRVARGTSGHRYERRKLTTSDETDRDGRSRGDRHRAPALPRRAWRWSGVGNVGVAVRTDLREAIWGVGRRLRGIQTTTTTCFWPMAGSRPLAWRGPPPNENDWAKVDGSCCARTHSPWQLGAAGPRTVRSPARRTAPSPRHRVPLRDSSVFPGAAGGAELPFVAIWTELHDVLFTARGLRSTGCAVLVARFAPAAGLSRRSTAPICG